MTETSHILVVAFHSNGHVSPETYDLVAFARELRQHRPDDIRIILIGADTEAEAAVIARKTGEWVHAIDCPNLSQYCGEAYRRLLVRELEKTPSSYLVALNNSQGLDFAPAVAAEADAACITGVAGLTKAEGGPAFEKQVFGGKIKETIQPCTRTCVLTVQPGLFKWDAQAPPEKGAVTHETAAGRLEKTRLLGTRAAAGDTSTITEAKVIVAAGNGIGDEENLTLIRELAGLFQKSAVAGTRIVCDQGWLGYNQQVGITGASISPDLYIACGISGAVQHVMGMQGAGLVIAINIDERAAIFNEADICVVEDLTRFIPLLLETYHNQTAVKDS